MGLVSDPLQAGVRLLRDLLPAPPTAFLAVGLPLAGRGYGFTVFRSNDAMG